MTKYRPSMFVFHRFLIATALVASPWITEVNAASYHADIQSGTWNSQNWVPNTGTAPGTTNGTPSTDEVTIDNAGSSVINLTLDGSRNLAKFTRFRALSTNGDSIRLVSASGGARLSVSDLFSVEDSSLYLRASSSSTTTRLTIEADRMEIGSTEWNGADPTGKSVGTLYLSGLVGANDYSRVTLSVSKTLSIIGNGRFSYEGIATGNALIDLGDVIFRDNVNSNGVTMNPTFSLGAAASSSVDHRVKIRSLQSQAAHSSGVSVTGGATVELYGNEPAEPMDYRFYGEIRETTRLEKTGSNKQILSRSAGNSYDGGTLISGGTLMVENSTGSGLGSGAVTVEGSGTLGGSGRIALGQGKAITVKSGGTLAPGKEGNNYNALRIVTPSGSSEPTLSMEEGSRFVFNIGTGNASNSIEFLNYSAGALALATGGVEIALEGALTEGVYQLFVFREGGEGSTLVSSGFSDGLFVNYSSGAFNVTLHYNNEAFGGPGVIAMEVTAVPEPSSMALLIFGIGASGIWLARRRSFVTA